MYIAPKALELLFKLFFPRKKWRYNKVINVAICEDIPKMQNFIVSAINTQHDMQVVATATCSSEIITKVAHANPDIVLMDIQLESDRAGIYATEAILEQNPNIKIIMLTAHDDSELIIDSYYAGAIDYITKSADAELIIERIRSVYVQADFLGPLIIKNLRSEFKKYRTRHESLLFFINSFSRLTTTERHILKQLYDGHTRKEIAIDNYLAITTVHTHVKHILKKLGYNSTKEMISFLKKIRLFEDFVL